MGRKRNLALKANDAASNNNHKDDKYNPLLCSLTQLYYTVVKFVFSLSSV